MLVRSVRPCESWCTVVVYTHLKILSAASNTPGAWEEVAVLTVALAGRVGGKMAAGGSQSRQELKLAVAEVRRHAHY